jgi:hypothetical protein
MLTMAVWRLKLEPGRAYRPAVIDSHHFDYEQDPDPDLSEKLDPDPDPH